MKVIISIFLLSFSLYANASVKIYASDTSIMGLEKTKGNVKVTSTLYGGSNSSGAASPADCVVKYSLKVYGGNYKGTLMPFSTETMSYSIERKNTASFEPVGSVITYISDAAIDVCPIGTDFTGDYELVNMKSPEYKTDFDTLIKFNYINALKVFHSNNIINAITLLEPYIQESIDNNYYYSDIFNDYGFLLQQVGRNNDAVNILNVVVKNTPKRVVAYLNIADAYWEMGDKLNASRNYKKYVSLMQEINNSKIPNRAIERSKL